MCKRNTAKIACGSFIFAVTLAGNVQIINIGPCSAVGSETNCRSGGNEFA